MLPALPSANRFRAKNAPLLSEIKYYTIEALKGILSTKREGISMEYTMGIDLGTSSVKAALLDRFGRLAGTAGGKYSISIPALGWAEQNPKDWWSAAKSAISELMRTTGIPKGQIKGIGFSGQMHGMVALNQEGRPVCPAIIWIDQRAGQESEDIQRIAAELGLDKKLMNRPIPGTMICSLLWMKRNRPAQFEAIRWVLSPKDYLRYRLSGEICADDTDASASLAFSVADRRWCTELLDKLGIYPAIFPEPVKPWQFCGKVTAGAAEEAGLAAGTSLAAGGADSAMQLVGNGVISQGTAACNIGTGAQVLTVAERPVFDNQLRSQTFCHAAPDAWYLQCGTLNGGSALNWLKNQALQAKADFEEFLRPAESIPTGAEGLLFLPYLAGERNPYLNPDAKGIFFGLAMKHGQGHLIRAVMEGVAYNLRECMDILGQLDLPMNRLIVSGGGAKGRLWRQILADMFNTPVYTTNTVEEACTGAAMMAAVGLGWYRDAAQAVEAVVRLDENATMPIPENAALYEENRPRFRQLYARTKELL